jgi:KAP-like P-loop domain-containing protein
MTQVAQTVALKAEDSSSVDTWPVTTDLAHVLAIAANANSVSTKPEQFDVTFSTILYGFLRGSDACCRFFQSFAASAGLHREQLLARKHLTEENLAGLGDSLPPEPTDHPLRYTRSAKNLLTNAQTLRHETSSGPAADPIDVRHLMGAYVYRPAGHGDELESLGLSRVKWSDAFRAWIRRSYPAEATRWEQIDRTTFQSIKSGDAGPFRPLASEKTAANDDRVVRSLSERFTFDSDAVLEKIPLDRDRMNMRPDVERFARLLAARDIAPPIALGLFGRWGSGKSFFMGMLRTRVDELTTAGSSNGYVANAVQITFNAWHYQDTNLWASIALRIFEGIALKLGDGQVSTPQDQRRELHRKLSSSKQLRADAEAKRDEASSRRAAVALELSANAQARAQRENRLSIERLANVWKRLVRDSPEFKGDIDGLKEDAEKLGLKTAVNGIEDIQLLQSRLKALDSRTQALVSAAQASFRNTRTGLWSCASIVLVIAVILFLDRLGGTLHLSAFSTAFLQIGTSLGAVAAWTTSRLQAVSRIAERAERMREKVVNAWQESDSSEKEKQLAAELRELDAAIQKQTEEIATAERRAAEAESEIQRIDEGGLVYDFLKERRASDRYTGQLGLISTIRQDLETLRTLLEDLRKEGKKPIDRIILYIDDLDRCQPDQVVQVLQAVHLLLAFDIFNVVVGVDGRWLEQSLVSQYASTGKDGQRDAPPSAFRAQNYLEKIFQIPYSLRSMDGDTFGKLVEELLPTRTEQPAAGGPTAGVHGNVQTNSPVIQGTRTNAATVPEPAPEKLDLGEAVGTLFFEDFEEEFLKKLYAFMNTPRLAKRMVNVYRLLRARAAAEDFETFLSSASTGTYRAALLLLAINIGAPEVGGKLLYLLSKETNDSDLGAFLERVLKEQSAPRFTDDQRAILARIHDSVRAIATDLPVELKPFQHWASRVGSYSFDWQLVGDEFIGPRAAL